MRCTPENSPELEDLQLAYKKVSAVVESVNERTRRVERVQKLVDIQESMEGHPEVSFN